MIASRKRKIGDEKDSTVKTYQYICITVNDLQVNATNVDNGVVFPAQNSTIALYSNSGQISTSIKLEKLNKKTSAIFKNINDKIEIKFHFSEEKVTICLPKEMNKNLLTFFKKYKPENKKNYCCVNFAYEIVYGRDFVKEDNSLTLCIPEKTKKNICYEEDLSPGNIIYMYKKLSNHEFINDHLAIYIGQNYYLSLFGISGPLIISSLDAMKKGFQAETSLLFQEKMENKNIKFLEKSRKLVLSGKKDQPMDKTMTKESLLTYTP